MNINKISLIIFVLLCNVLLLSAQEVDSKYLAGAVPLVDGKVQFEREVKVSSAVSKSQLFDLVEKWMQEEFAEQEDSNQRILLTDKQKDYIVAQGDENLVFKSQILMLDQARITYQLIARVEAGKCKLEIRNIRYDYQDYTNSMPAEEMITDKVALHKNGEKLNRHYDKFRTFTIDRVDELKNNLMASLGKTSIEDVKVVQPEKISIVTVVGHDESSESPISNVASDMSVRPDMSGYGKRSADEISQALKNMMKDSRAVVTMGSASDAMMYTGVLKGVSSFEGVPVVSVYTSDKDSSSDVYTISFYTEVHADALNKLESAPVSDRKLTDGLQLVKTPEGGAAFNTAWMIIECSKMMDSKASESDVKQNAESKLWKNNSKPELVVGKILNIWVK